jgi:hypothetical protein
MVQTLATNNILIRKSIPSDIKFISEATIVVNGAYRSEGNRRIIFWIQKKILININRRLVQRKR